MAYLEAMVMKRLLASDHSEYEAYKQTFTSTAFIVGFI
jgi:hypothetical protein